MVGHQLHDLLVLPARSTGRVLVQEVAAVSQLLAIQLDAELKVFHRSLLLLAYYVWVTYPVVYPLPGREDQGRGGQLVGARDGPEALR